MESSPLGTEAPNRSTDIPPRNVGRSVAILAPDDRTDEIPAILRKIRNGETVSHFESVPR